MGSETIVTKTGATVELTDDMVHAGAHAMFIALLEAKVFAVPDQWTACTNIDYNKLARECLRGALKRVDHELERTGVD